MSVDKGRLKALAESAQAEMKRAIELCASGNGWEALPAQASFRSVASPAVVINLITEIESLEEQKQSLVSMRESHGFNSWAGVLVITDQLRAEIEALRKDAQRLTWLDEHYTHVVDGYGESAELIAIRWSVEGQCSSVRDAIDAASAEERSQ